MDSRSGGAGSVYQPPPGDCKYTKPARTRASSNHSSSTTTGRLGRHPIHAIVPVCRSDATNNCVSCVHGLHGEPRACVECTPRIVTTASFSIHPGGTCMLRRQQTPPPSAAAADGWPGHQSGVVLHHCTSGHVAQPHCLPHC